MSVEEGIRLGDDVDESEHHMHVRSAQNSSSSSSGAGKHEQDTVALLVENLINNTKEHNVMLLTIILALGNAADAIEICCIGFIMTEIPDITTEDKEYLSAAVFLGMFFGGIICGFLSDYVGRKPCLLYSLGLNTIAGYASVFSPNILTLIACRVIGGIGIGGSVPAVFSLGAEMFPSHVRGKLLSVVASFWMVGAIFTASAAWIMLGDDFNGHKIMASVTGWRPFAAVCATPALLTFILTWAFIPESPRYLLGKKEYYEAARALEVMSGVPVRPSDLMRKEKVSKAAAASVGGNVVSKFDPVVPLRGARGGTMNQIRESTLARLFAPSLIKTTLVLMVIWFMLCFGSYGISTWISELFIDIGVSNAYADAFIFALANLPGNIISICYVETLGRRRLLTYGMGLSGLAAFGFAIDTKQKELVVLFAALFNAFSTVGWNSLDCLSVESFPTNVRTSAMGILAASGRMGAIVAQFVNGSLEDNVPALLGVTSVFMILGGLLSWLLDNDNTGTQLADSEDEMSPADTASGVGHGYTSISSTTHSPL